MQSFSRVAVLFLAIVLLVGATRVATPPPANRVVVTLKDGTSLSGELIEATPAGVTLRPSPKSPPITKAWTQIKQLSNGTTRQMILDQWRAAHADKLCETCKGEGVVACPDCGGKGVESATAKPCEKCGGTGTLGKCRTPHCEAGKIPCPNPCLRPSDFHGTPDKDGKRWKTFRAKGGASAKWSDGHVGDLIVYEDGNPVDKGKCPRCGGKSVIDDPACHGTGSQSCPACHGHGVIGDDCKRCDDGNAPCPTCQGTGLKPSATQPSEK